MENQQHEEKITKSRGIYLLPNLFTTGALFTGFYSIVAALKGDFDIAAISVFFAMILDTLDGRVARLTNTQTAFGAEYDSLSDLVAFGIAPALVIYSWSLVRLGKLGWLVAFIYAACTALRLARFNTQLEHSDKRYFQGLPCPAAAGVVAGIVWVGFVYDIVGFFIAIPAAMLTVFVAVCMVSTIRYQSFKQINLKGKIPFIAVVLLVLIIAAVAISPPQMLFLIFLIYAFSGPVLTLWQVRKVRKLAKSTLRNIRRQSSQ
jgi:CDP-diacylglycerol--serine O-phosphatidyltransferase